ncbi:MAG TPA: SurA N-terminal domain-containing protein [Bacillales bacterium]|nr:SurA N-terminal domain-containing protein [Bacillales bacterium]
MWRKGVLGLMGAVLVLALAACGGNEEGKSAKSGDDGKSTEKEAHEPKMKGLVDEDKTVVIVNGEKVKGATYNPILKRIEQMHLLAQAQKGDQKASKADIYKKSKQQALDSVIGQTLLLQDADKKGYRPSEEEVNDRVEQLKQQYGGEKKLKQTLSEQNMTMAELKKNMGMKIEWETYLEKEVDVNVTDKEIQAFYENYKEKTEKPKKLAEIKPQIKKELERQKKQQKINDIVDELKKKSEIEVKI